MSPRDLTCRKCLSLPGYACVDPDGIPEEDRRRSGHVGLRQCTRSGGIR